jgi:hypothetical protein
LQAQAKASKLLFAQDDVGTRLTVEKASGSCGAGFKLATCNGHFPAFKICLKNGLSATSNKVLRWNSAKGKIWGLQLLHNLLQQGLEALLVPADLDELEKQKAAKARVKQQAVPT